MLVLAQWLHAAMAIHCAVAGALQMCPTTLAVKTACSKAAAVVRQQAGS